MRTRSVTIRTRRGAETVVAPADQTLAQVAQARFPRATVRAQPDGTVTVTSNRETVAVLEANALHLTLWSTP